MLLTFQINRKVKNMINEGKHDKYTFKAIFLIGAPASGKTEFYEQALKHKNLKHLDPDKVMAFLINKYGGDLKDTSSYSKWEKNIKGKLESMNNMYKKGGLGLVIDGTGRNFTLIENLKKDLELHGYKTFMVYINTPITYSVNRYKQRNRAVDKEFIFDTHKKLNTLSVKYKKIFNNFIEVNDIKDYSDAEKKINQWLNK